MVERRNENSILVRKAERSLGRPKLRIGTSGGLFEHGKQPSNSVKYSEHADQSSNY
jgi:hypothetical protein